MSDMWLVESLGWAETNDKVTSYLEGWEQSLGANEEQKIKESALEEEG